MPPNEGGVYLLSAFCMATPVLQVFYVGQSSRLRRRLTEHLVGVRTFARHLRGHLSTYFLCAAASRDLMRSAAEAALIRHFKPAGNAVMPAALAVEVNLPDLSILPDQPQEEM